MNTNWPQIRLLEEDLADQDLHSFIEFLFILRRNYLLHKSLFHFACESSKDPKKAWALLHEHAGMKYPLQ